MVDMTQDLGRKVITPAEVLSLIRGDLRIMRAHYQGVIAAARAGWLDTNPDLELTDGNDVQADDAVFTALLETAYGNVVDWSADERVVFDKDKVREFIRRALIDAMVTERGEEALPEGALDY
jgi:hypothetical protein